MVKVLGPIYSRSIWPSTKMTMVGENREWWLMNGSEYFIGYRFFRVDWFLSDQVQTNLHWSIPSIKPSKWLDIDGWIVVSTVHCQHTLYGSATAWAPGKQLHQVAKLKGFWVLHGGHVELMGALQVTLPHLIVSPCSQSTLRDFDWRCTRGCRRGCRRPPSPPWLQPANRWTFCPSGISGPSSIWVTGLSASQKPFGYDQCGRCFEVTLVRWTGCVPSKFEGQATTPKKGRAPSCPKRFPFGGLFCHFQQAILIRVNVDIIPTWKIKHA